MDGRCKFMSKYDICQYMNFKNLYFFHVHLWNLSVHLSVQTEPSSWSLALLNSDTQRLIVSTTSTGT